MSVFLEDGGSLTLAARIVMGFVEGSGFHPDSMRNWIS
jgi:hypothetical protein